MAFATLTMSWKRQSSPCLGQCAVRRVGNSLIDFLFVFCEWKSESVIHSFLSRSNFGSFLKSDVSESLTVALLWWATWANCSSHSFVKCDGSGLLKSLFKKEQMSEEQREPFALWHKKGESRANHSHCSFLKSDESYLLFCKEQHEQITHVHSLKWAILSERANSQPWLCACANMVNNKTKPMWHP